MKNREKRESQGKLYEGIIFITGKGLGYVTLPDFKEDIEIKSNFLKSSWHKDTVLISLSKAGKKERLQGKVEKILKRNKKLFSGTVEKKENNYILIPDDKKARTIIKITEGNPQNNLGQKASILITNWGENNKEAEGKLQEIFGKKGDNSAEMKSILSEKGFGFTFEKSVENEAKQVDENSKKIWQEESKKRKDFRNTLTFTIDPKTAKDFDDAISFKKISDGRFEIGVHIADVSFYVREKTEMDREARKRGFSVYLPDRTIPMLPSILSDNLCSLNEGEEKMAYSAVFELDKNGKVLSKWFGKTVIKSAKRFSYESAQEILNKKSSQYFNELNTLNLTAKKLQKEKIEKGAIDFEHEEIEFEMDEYGKVLSINKKIRLDTHKLVEEYMLLANKEVAHFLYKTIKAKGFNFSPIFRIHDIPDKEKITELSLFVHALGHTLPRNKEGGVSGRDLQMLFKKIEGKDEEALIKTTAIRSMSKAVYSTKNIGHFGLAFEYYTHFTSPIRRYPDLCIHRILEKVINKETLTKNDWDNYEKIASESSQNEIRATEAEREARKLKQIEFISAKIGQTFDGTITGVTEWGIYVEEKETKTEGMVKLSSIGDDYYILDKKKYAIIGQKTKKKFALGDKVKIKLVGADADKKTVDYKIVE
jgi:ribonuclease R